MTTKISGVSFSSGETVLTITYDNPCGSGVFSTFKLKKSDLFERLLRVKTLLGRELTLLDAQQALVAIIDEVRVNKTSIPEDFDFSPYIGVELEV